VGDGVVLSPSVFTMEIGFCMAFKRGGVVVAVVVVSVVVVAVVVVVVVVLTLALVVVVVSVAVMVLVAGDKERGSRRSGKSSGRGLNQVSFLGGGTCLC
jgi:uncharacterized membrane protein YgcG